MFYFIKYCTMPLQRDSTENVIQITWENSFSYKPYKQGIADKHNALSFGYQRKEF